MKRAKEILESYLPSGAYIDIEETDQRLITKYIVRVTYTSKKSGKKVTLIARSNNLPKSFDDYASIVFLTSQEAFLRPEQVPKMFSYVSWQERRSRQDQFLFGGGKMRGNDVRVHEEGSEMDNVSYVER